MNPPSLNRRHFLQTALPGIGAAVAGGLRPCGAAAAEPIRRTGKPYMKLSLAAYSFNRLLPRSKPLSEWDQYEMTLDSFIELCAALDLDATELTGYYFPRDITSDYLMHLKEKTFRLGLDISGTAIGNNFCVPEGEQRTQQIAQCKEWIDHAAALGAPVIRIFAGTVPKGDSETAAAARCASAISECLKHAAARGVFLALENHGGITATPESMLRIIEQVEPSPWFGVNFDSGNFRTDDPYRDLAKIAPYAVTAQIKSVVTAGGKKEEADLPRLIGILRDAGYRGYVALEYEEKDPRENVPRYIDKLRKAIEG